MPFKLDLTPTGSSKYVWLDHSQGLQADLGRTNVPAPPGFVPVAHPRDVARASAAPSPDAVARQAKQSTDIKMRRAWDLALAPAKSLPMQAIMLYFSGSGVQIFSLGMIFMLLTSPITAVLNLFGGQCILQLSSIRLTSVVQLSRHSGRRSQLLSGRAQNPLHPATYPSRFQWRLTWAAKH